MQAAVVSLFWLVIGSVISRICCGLRGDESDRLGLARVGLATSSGCGKERIPHNPGHPKD